MELAYSYFLQCSASCGDGQKSRDAKCLDKNKRPSSSCDPASMPRESASCNVRKCPQAGPGRPEPSGTEHLYEPRREKTGHKPGCTTTEGC